MNKKIWRKYSYEKTHAYIYYLIQEMNMYYLNNMLNFNTALVKHISSNNFTKQIGVSDSSNFNGGEYSVIDTMLYFDYEYIQFNSSRAKHTGIKKSMEMIFYG